MSMSINYHMNHMETPVYEVEWLYEEDSDKDIVAMRFYEGGYDRVTMFLTVEQVVTLGANIDAFLSEHGT